MCGRPFYRSKIGDNYELGSFWGGRRFSWVWDPENPLLCRCFRDWLAGPAGLFVIFSMTPKMIWCPFELFMWMHREKVHSLSVWFGGCDPHPFARLGAGGG